MARERAKEEHKSKHVQAIYKAQMEAIRWEFSVGGQTANLALAFLGPLRSSRRIEDTSNR